MMIWYILTLCAISVSQATNVLVTVDLGASLIIQHPTFLTIVSNNCYWVHNAYSSARGGISSRSLVVWKIADSDSGVFSSFVDNATKTWLVVVRSTGDQPYTPFPPAFDVLAAAVSITAATKPRLGRFDFTPRSVVLAANSAINVSVDPFPGSAPLLAYFWTWGAQVIVTRAPWLLFFPAGTGAGVLICVAHSSVGNSESLAVLFLTVTRAPLLIISPPEQLTVTSGDRVVLAASASGSGNTFVWQRRLGIFDSHFHLKSDVSNAFTATTLVLPRVGMTDATGGIELHISNPAGMAPVVQTTLLVRAPPWSLRCAPPVVLFTPEATTAITTLTAIHKGPWFMITISAVPIIDSTVCGAVVDRAIPRECLTSVDISWSASVHSDHGATTACAWDFLVPTGVFQTSFGRGGRELSQILFLYPQSNASSVVLEQGCFLSVNFSAVPFSPFSQDPHFCFLKGVFLHVHVSRTMTVGMGESTQSPMTTPQPSATPFPSWVLISSPNSASTSLTVRAAPSTTALPSSGTSSMSPSALIIAPAGSMARFEGEGDDLLMIASSAGLALGAAIATLLLLSSCRNPQFICRAASNNILFKSSFWQVIQWLQFAIVLDQSILPLHFRYSKMSAALPWASGILPFNGLSSQISCTPPQLSVTGDGFLQPLVLNWGAQTMATSYGLPRFGMHMCVTPASLPAMALVSLLCWCVFALVCIPLVALGGGMASSRILIGRLKRRGTSSSAGFFRRFSQVRILWSAVLQACLTSCAISAVLVMPSGLVGGLWTAAHWSESTVGSTVAAAIALALWCFSLLILSLGRIRNGRRSVFSVFLQVMFFNVTPTLIIGMWGISNWLFQGLALCTVYLIQSIWLIAEYFMIHKRFQNLSSTGSLDLEYVQLLRLLLQVTVLSCLMVDADSLPTFGGPSSATLLLKNTGTVIAIVLQCCWGALIVVLALCRAIYMRLKSWKTSHHTDIDEALGLNVSFFGGRNVLDVEGMLAFWAILCGLVGLVGPHDVVPPLELLAAAPNPLLKSSGLGNTCGGDMLVSAARKRTENMLETIDPLTNNSSASLARIVDDKTAMKPTGSRRTFSLQLPQSAGSAHVTEFRDSSEILTVYDCTLQPPLSTHASHTIPASSTSVGINRDITPNSYGIARVFHHGQLKHLSTLAPLPEMTECRTAAVLEQIPPPKFAEVFHSGSQENHFNRIGFKPISSRGFVSHHAASIDLASTEQGDGANTTNFNLMRMAMDAMGTALDEAEGLGIAATSQISPIEASTSGSHGLPLSRQTASCKPTDDVKLDISFSNQGEEMPTTDGSGSQAMAAETGVTTSLGGSASATGSAPTSTFVTCASPHAPTLLPVHAKSSSAPLAIPIPCNADTSTTARPISSPTGASGSAVVDLCYNHRRANKFSGFTRHGLRVELLASLPGRAPHYAFRRHLQCQEAATGTGTATGGGTGTQADNHHDHA